MSNVISPSPSLQRGGKVKRNDLKLTKKFLPLDVWQWQKEEIKAKLRNPQYIEFAINGIGSALAEKFGSLEKATGLKK